VSPVAALPSPKENLLPAEAKRMGAVGRRRREHGRGERCGLADGADGEGRSDGDGEGVISGVGIAAGKRRGAVRKKRRQRQKHRGNILLAAREFRRAKIQPKTF